MIIKRKRQSNEYITEQGRKVQQKDRFRTLRQWLNIIFMLGAITGVIVWYATDATNTGIIIILASMVFKFVEATLRIIR